MQTALKEYRFTLQKTHERECGRHGLVEAKFTRLRDALGMEIFEKAMDQEGLLHGDDAAERIAAAARATAVKETKEEMST